MKTLSIVVLSSVLALTSATALARPGEGYGSRMKDDCKAQQRGPAAKMERMLAGMDLTDEQKANIEALVAQANVEQPDPEQRQALREAARQQRQDLMAQTEFDEAAVREMIAGNQQQMLERKVEHMKLMHGIMQQLTDEQRAVLQDRMARKMNRMQKHLQQ